MDALLPIVIALSDVNTALNKIFWVLVLYAFARILIELKKD